jgi:hypothetical protein
MLTAYTAEPPSILRAWSTHEVQARWPERPSKRDVAYSQQQLAEIAKSRASLETSKWPHVVELSQLFFDAVFSDMVGPHRDVVDRASAPWTESEARQAVDDAQLALTDAIQRCFDEGGGSSYVDELIMLKAAHDEARDRVKGC